MDVLRTPDESFHGIGFEIAPRYLGLAGPDGTPLRMHYIDEGPRDGRVVFCLHGQPSWSFLYRKMVGPLTAAGLRVIAPDLIGFGKSDKPTEVADYTYGGHVDWVAQFISQLDLTDMIGLFQDWGGMIGLRVVERMPDRFAGLLVTNTLLLDSADVPPEASAMLADAYSHIAVPSAAEVARSFADGDPLAAVR